MRRRCLAAGLVVVSLAGLVPLAPAGAQEAVYDQANHAQNIQTAIQTYLAILQRITQILNQLQDLAALEEPEYRQIRTLLLRLAQILREAEGLVYSLEDLDGRFRELYPGYEPAEDVSERYEDRVEVLLDTARGVLLSTKENARDLEEAQWTLGTLREQLLAAEGNLEAMHSQGILIGFLAEEVSKTNQQSMALTNLLAVEAAHRLQTESEALATFEEWLEESHGPAPTYDSGPMHPLVPGSLPF